MSIIDFILSDPFISLVAISGGITAFFWTVTYILIIRQGIKDQAVAMPFAAMCANTGWEFVYTFIYPEHQFLQLLVNVVWFFLDVGIIAVYVKYGREQFRQSYPERFFIPFLGIGLLVSTILHSTFYLQFDQIGVAYSAFGINLMMSVLFLRNILLTGSSIKGHSMPIAISKMIGTGFSSLYFAFKYPGNPFLLSLYILIIIFDLAYTAVLYMRTKQNLEKQTIR